MEKELATRVLATRHHQTVTTIELVCVQRSRKVTIDVDGRKCEVGGVVFGKDGQQVGELGVTTAAGCREARATLVVAGKSQSHALRCMKRCVQQASIIFASSGALHERCAMQGLKNIFKGDVTLRQALG